MAGADVCSEPMEPSTHPLDAQPNLRGGSGEHDATLARMKRLGRPLTREVYLSMEYPDGVPDPLPAELEDMIPDELRLPDQEA